jgi:hypothetical protein
VGSGSDVHFMCYVHLMCLDVGAAGGTAFDVRAGLFAGRGLTDKILTSRGSLYGGKFASHIDEATARFHSVAFS